MKTEKYNGYTNYQTWCVMTWVLNDEGTYYYFCELALWSWTEAVAHIGSDGIELFSRETCAATDLADGIKVWFEEQNPCTAPNMWADLMGAALSEVNWREIAEHFIEGVEKEEEEEEKEVG